MHCKCIEGFLRLEPIALCPACFMSRFKEERERAVNCLESMEVGVRVEGVGGGGVMWRAERGASKGITGASKGIRADLLALAGLGALLGVHAAVELALQQEVGSWGK